MQKFINMKSLQAYVSRVRDSHARTDGSSPGWASSPTHPVRWVQGQIIPKRKQLYEGSWKEKNEALGGISRLILAPIVLHNQNSWACFVPGLQAWLSLSPASPSGYGLGKPRFNERLPTEHTSGSVQHLSQVVCGCFVVPAF